MLTKALARTRASFARIDKKALAAISAFVALVFAVTLVYAPHRTPATAAAATMVSFDTTGAAMIAKAEVKAEDNAAEAATKAAEASKVEELKEEASRVASVDRSEILWLARGIYSETKEPHEQELVAWVIRNRVETEYRGKDSYKEVVLDPWQFSAFNSNSPVRRFYTSLTENSSSRGWKTAIGIAERVATATENERPFSETTRHFYSEQSMRGGRKPAWAAAKAPVKLPNVEERRFRFYAGVR